MKNVKKNVIFRHYCLTKIYPFLFVWSTVNYILPTTLNFDWAYYIHGNIVFYFGHLDSVLVLLVVMNNQN